MEAYVLGIGILVTVLFLTGIFFTIREFREMEKNPRRTSHRKGPHGYFRLAVQS